jgi:hypothetical protein
VTGPSATGFEEFCAVPSHGHVCLKFWLWEERLSKVKKDQRPNRPRSPTSSAIGPSSQQLRQPSEVHRHPPGLVSREADCHCLTRAKCSRARRIAGLSGFLTLNQSWDGPDQYGAVNRFDTMSSSPILQACRTPPASVRSLSAIPTCTRASSRARRSLR